MAELEDGKIEVEQSGEVYKLRKGMLVVHHKTQSDELDYWRMVIPDDNSVTNFVVTELQAIPFSLHPGVQRTLQKVKNTSIGKG